jgi:small-conductance mechanosensitive channel
VVRDELGAWLSHPISGLGAGLAMAVVALVLLMFGVALVVSGFDKSARPDLPRWHPRRWMAPSLDFYMGLLLIELDGLLYAYFAALLLTTHGTVPLWFGVLAVNGCILAVLAFKHFAQDRRRTTT